MVKAKIWQHGINSATVGSPSSNIHNIKGCWQRFVYSVRGSVAVQKAVLSALPSVSMRCSLPAAGKVQKSLPFPDFVTGFGKTI